MGTPPPEQVMLNMVLSPSTPQNKGSFSAPTVSVADVRPHHLRKNAILNDGKSIQCWSQNKPELLPDWITRREVFLHPSIYDRTCAHMGEHHICQVQQLRREDQTRKMKMSNGNKERETLRKAWWGFK